MPALTLALRRPTYGSGSKTSYTGTAGSAYVPADSKTVIVWCSSNAFVALKKTATTSDLPIPAGVVVQIPVNNPDGAPIQVSAIQDTAGGSMYCIGCAE